MLGIKRWFGTGFKPQAEVEAEKDKQYEIYNEELRLRGKKPVDWREEEAEDRKRKA